MPKYAEEILAAVTELQQHPTAEQVFLEMKREHPSIALGTVYLPCLPGAGKARPVILWRRSIMNAKVSKLINEQINKEFYSAYLYLDFANYYAAVGLDGFENWYRVQAQEERDHAMLFYQYLQNNGEGVTFEAIAKPEWERGDHMTPLKKALEHEKLVTASIDAIYAAAYEAKDFRTMQMLDWFIKEQGEEEKNAADLITKMELFGGDSKGLYMLNSELKARVYTAPRWCCKPRASAGFRIRQKADCIQVACLFFHQMVRGD